MLEYSNKYFISFENMNLETNDQYQYKINQNSENEEKVTVYIYGLIDKISFEIKNGDFIYTIKDGYKNDGILIWDGQKALFLDGSIDKYGNIPDNFIVDDENFHPYYWKYIDLKTNIYWPCKKYREQVANSLKFDSNLSDRDLWHGTFTQNDIIYYVFVDYENYKKISRDENNYELYMRNLQYVKTLILNEANPFNINAEYKFALDISISDISSYVSF